MSSSHASPLPSSLSRSGSDYQAAETAARAAAKRAERAQRAALVAQVTVRLKRRPFGLQKQCIASWCGGSGGSSTCPVLREAGRGGHALLSLTPWHCIDTRPLTLFPCSAASFACPQAEEELARLRDVVAAKRSAAAAAGAGAAKLFGDVQQVVAATKPWYAGSGGGGGGSGGEQQGAAAAMATN